jgi:hypothetical protein
MNVDQVIELRRHWERWNFASFLPEATVLASADWTRYVRLMAAQIPRDQQTITWPSEQEAAWGWPEGVAIVLEEPFELEHTIISKGDAHHPAVEVDPHPEAQEVAGVVFGIGQVLPTRIAFPQGDVRMPEREGLWAIPILFIATDPSDIISAHWSPGGSSLVRGDPELVSESSCFLLALINALGHRVTLVSEPAFAGRGERRRLQRALPDLRVLRLTSHASVSASEAPGGVAWSHRWIVRGHWHTVSHGPRHTLKRLQWYDSFVKGPDDKPFDDRRTVWKT